MSSRPARRWTPTPILYASAAVHMGTLAALAARPRAWPWALGILAANHMALAGAGLWPRSGLLGPNWTRLPEGGAAGMIAVTIDDGPDPLVTPRVLQMLDEHRALATFFCVGDRVEKYPELAQEIVRRGHPIENHTQHHPSSFALMGPSGMRAEIFQAQECILRITGSSPRFFRAPAGLRNPFLDPVLARLNLRLASWTRRGFDTVDGNAEAVFRRLTRTLRAGDILLLHDGNGARGSGGGGAVILEVLPRLLDELTAHGLKSVTLRSAIP